MPVRDGKARHLIAAKNVVILNFFSNGNGVGDGFLHHLRLEVIGEEVCHLLL